MKKFFIKIVAFFFIVSIIDILSGKVFSYLGNHAKGGDNKRSNLICNEIKDDILIFGSSRAFHHYNPIIITDSLKLSCYNCGQDATGAILNYGRYHLICQRHHPKYVIYDIMPAYDLLIGEDNHKYLGWLRPFYNREGIKDIFESIDKTEKYKMQSQLYRYNSKFIQILSDYIHPMESEGIKGFRPIQEEMDTMKVLRKSILKEKNEYDSLKLYYMKKIINESKKTRIIFVVSPFWVGMDTTSLQPIRSLCKEYNIPLLDFSNNPKYIHNDFYFKDGSHLNARGADEFTKDLIQELKKKNIIN